MGCRRAAPGGGAKRAQGGQAGYGRVPFGAARCARRCQGSCWRHRDLLDECRRSPRARRSLARDDRDPQRHLVAAEVSIPNPRRGACVPAARVSGIPGASIKNAAMGTSSPGRGFSMDMSIALILGQDGITNGAIYALLALALVLVFAVTRVIFIQQGEFVAYGALTLAMMQSGALPATVWLLVVMGVLVTVLDGAKALKAGQGRRAAGVAGWNLAYPLALAGLLSALPANTLPLALQVILTLAIVVPMGPMMYRLMYQPIASAPVLILLIVSVALHITMVGRGQRGSGSGRYGC